MTGLAIGEHLDVQSHPQHHTKNDFQVQIIYLNNIGETIAWTLTIQNGL